MAPCFKCKNKDMEYREKHQAALKLQDNRFVDQDRELLRRYQPHSSLMSRSIKMRNGESLSFEIIFLLLDYVSPQEIVAHRTAFLPKVVSDKEYPHNTDKKKGLPSMKSFHGLSGKISQILSFKKQS